MNPKATGQPTIGMEISPAPPNHDWKRIEKDFEAEVQKGLKLFRDEIEKVWQEKASAKLDNTLNEYMSGISIEVEGEGVSATITGWLPVALEEGSQRFDMKPGLLRNANSRVIPIQDGGFRTVSTNSPGYSWWHPGIQANKIGEEVKQEAEVIAEKIFSPIFERIKI